MTDNGSERLEHVSQQISQRHSISEPVLIRGTGLLGTSIGLGLRAEAELDVLLHDPSPSAQAIAQDIGAGRIIDLDEITGSMDKHPGTVIVATPPDVTGQVVIDSLRRFPEATVLDIASVKGAIAEEVADSAAQDTTLDTTRYVGTHPMAGRERSGPVAARGQLFTAAPWVITAAESTRPEAIAIAEDIARLLGATVYRMTPEAHDEAVALISHLPQISASMLASRLQNTPAEALALAGNGLRDTTRIAGSDPGLWVQILTANAEQILPELYGMREDLNRLITTMEDPTADGARLDVAQLIAEGNRGQARIPGKHGGSAQGFSVITVLVDDTPGQIVAALSDLADAGGNVEDLRMDHSSGYRVGMLEISVLPGTKKDLTQALTDRGWKVL